MEFLTNSCEAGLLGSWELGPVWLLPSHAPHYRPGKDTQRFFTWMAGEVSAGRQMIRKYSGNFKKDTVYQSCGDGKIHLEELAAELELEEGVEFKPSPGL